MMRPLVRLLLALVVLAAMGTSFPGCTITDPVTGKTVIGQSMSDEEEARLGAEYGRSFTAMYEGPYPDRDLQEYCGRIVLGMARKSHRGKLPWEFTILNSSQVNAFALPGGKVFITRGLLWRLSSEAEFAGVMGHEIGHVSHKHGLQSMGRAKLAGGLIKVLDVAAEHSGQELAKLGAGLGAGVANLVLLKYSRGQESESDQRGVEYSYEAGYDPREMAGVFETFKRLKGGKSPPVWLSSHPLDDDRIAAVGEEVRRRYPAIEKTDGKGLVKSPAGWGTRIARLSKAQQVYDVYDQAAKDLGKALKKKDKAALEGILEKLADCERRLPGHALFPGGAGVVLYYAGRSDEAKRKLAQAVSMQGDLFEPHLYLAQIAWDRRDGRTVHAEAKRAREIFPEHPHPYYLEGRMFDEEGDRRKATAFYKEVLKLAPKKSEDYQYAAKRLRELGGGRKTSPL
ncbi:MAG: M48 family metalloprotease [Planctomycetota bacterium]|jgi:predicted Zn-dependent protease